MKLSNIISVFSVLCAFVFFPACTSNYLNDDIASSPKTNNNIGSQSQLFDDKNTEQVPGIELITNKKKIEPGFLFSKVRGAPQSALSNILTAIKKSAKSNGIRKVDHSQPEVSFIVRSSYTAIDDGAGTTLLSFWEIEDLTGQVVHRISFQETNASRTSDPWLAVGSNLIDRIVQRSMESVRLWIDTKI